MTFEQKLKDILKDVLPTGNNTGYRFSNGESFPSLEEYRQNVIDRLTQLFEEESKAYLRELETEMREYRTKYPDATWDDAIGYIAGYRLRPEKKA